MEQYPVTTAEPPDFSLVLGGPLYQLMLRAGLARPSMDLLGRRIIAFAAVTWLPLAGLTALGGRFLGGVKVPFLYDLDVHSRFLLALPLLIAAEVFVHHRMWEVVVQFRERDLIAPEDQRSFDAIISDASRLRNSVLIEVLLLLFSFIAGYWVWRSQASLHVASWYAINPEEPTSFTGAGYWYVFVSVPIFRFILCRWYFRLFVWYVLLFRVSRLPLRLNALHPDRAGGLDFLSLSAIAMAPVLIAQTIFLAGFIANHIWHEDASLLAFKFLIGGYLVLLLLVPLVPLAFFALQMAAARRAALRAYGSLGALYANEFGRKWLPAPSPGSNDLLGTADIQALSDLANSYAVVREMRLLPFGKNLAIQLLVLIALPLLPLTFTLFPADIMLQQLIKFIL